MAKGISKKETAEKIEEFFKNIKDKAPKEIKKIKTLAMSRNIPLKDKRKTFCGRCFSAYRTPRIRIRNRIKSVTCGNCGAVSRWKVKKIKIS